MKTRLLTALAISLLGGCVIAPTTTTTRAVFETDPEETVPGPSGASTLSLQVTENNVFIAAYHPRTCTTRQTVIYEVTEHWTADLTFVNDSSALLAFAFAPIVIPVSGFFTGVAVAVMDGKKHREPVTSTSAPRSCPELIANAAVEVEVPGSPAVAMVTDARGWIVMPRPTASGMFAARFHGAMTFQNFVAPEEAAASSAVRKMVVACGNQRHIRGVLRVAIHDNTVDTDSIDPAVTGCMRRAVAGLARASGEPIELTFAYHF